MLLEEKRVGEIVSEDYRSAHLFSKYGIDFCCGGKKTLKDACDTARADMENVVKDLESLKNQGEPENAIESLSTEALVEHILQTHHSYIRDKSELLKIYLNKMVHAHGKAHPEVTRLSYLANALIDELLPHLLKEENVLFPAILHIVKGETSLGFPKEHVQFPIHAMESEHENAGELVKMLEMETNAFNPPAYACTTWRVCYSTLEEFVRDLKTHIHLENNVLFPRIMELIR